VAGETPIAPLLLLRTYDGRRASETGGTRFFPRPNHPIAQAR